MKMQFKMPNITAPTILGQIQQINSFLRQLVGDLQMMVSTPEEAASTPFALTPYNNGIAIKDQSCRFYSGMKLVQGQVVAKLNGQTITEGVFFPVLQIPKAYAPRNTVAASAVMPGVGLCNCYIQGRDSQAPGMVFIACDKAGASGAACVAAVSFVFRKED